MSTRDEAVCGDFDALFEEEYASSPELRSAIDAFAESYDRGAQVVLARRGLGWTQAELAQKAGLDQADISRIERGQGNHTDKTWDRIAEALGLRWHHHLVKREGQFA